MELKSNNKLIYWELREFENLADKIKKIDRDATQFYKEKQEFKQCIAQYDLYFKATVNDEVIKRINRIKEDGFRQIEEAIEDSKNTQRKADAELCDAKRTAKNLIGDAEKKAEQLVKDAELKAKQIIGEAEQSLKKRDEYLQMKQSAEEANQQLDKVRKMFISISKIMSNPEIEKARQGLTFTCYGEQSSCGFPAMYAYKVGKEWHLSACMVCADIHKDRCPHCGCKSDEKIKISYWNN